MNRRGFLLAGAAAILTGGRAMAGMKMDSMPGMHGAGHGMAAKPGPLPSLPEGAPLGDLPRLANRSAEAGLFEATLTAAPTTAGFVEGLATPILGYNGGSPGPLLEVTEGDRIRIVF